MAKTTSQIVAENKRRRTQERETGYQRNRQSVRTRKEEAANRRPPASQAGVQREQANDPASPENLCAFLNAILEGRDQKKRELRDYTRNFYTPMDSTGRRLTYQEAGNIGSVWTAPGGQSYLENQTLGSLAGDQGKAYLQGLGEKTRALNEAQQKANQAIYGIDMYEISHMTLRERDALANYLWARDYIREDGTGMVVDDLPEKKREVLNLLGDRYDMKRIDELAETYGRSLNAEAVRAAWERGEQRGNGDTWSKIWSSTLTVPAKLAGDIASPLTRLNELANSTGRYSGFDPNGIGGVFDAYSQGVRGAVEEDIRGDGESTWRNLAALGYRGGMGVLDTAAGVALYGNYAPIFSGIGAFGDRITDASSKGASYGEALTLAGADALITAALRKIPLDQLLGMDRSAPKGFLGMLGDAVKMEAAEAGTGALGGLANMAVEQAVLQDRSGYSREIALKMLDGTSFEDAKRAVDGEIRRRFIEDAAVEAFSGFGSSLLMAGYSHVSKAYEKAQTRKQDQAELAELQDVLGPNAPQSLEEFQELKYNSGQWELFKAYQGEIKGGKLTPLADFPLFLEVGKKTDAMLVGATTSDGIQIADKTIHFSSRVIGSIEERRSGVNLEDVLEALTNPNTTILPIKYDKYGMPSQKYRYGNVEVTINPETGYLVQTNPTQK